MPKMKYVYRILVAGFCVFGAGVHAQETTAIDDDAVVAQDEIPVTMADVEQAYQRGDFVFVREALQKIATRDGSPLAQYRLGRVLFEGIGGLRDQPAAIGWLEKAVAQNNADAATLLGRIYLSAGSQRDPVKASELLSSAAARGHPEAQYYLGLLYQNGTGVEQDAVQAFNWFLAASEAGNASAQFELSRALVKGVGTPQNQSEALRWLEEAAGRGQVDAQYYLGQTIEAGEGVAKSSENALKWYRRAAEGGQPLAQRTLGTKYLQGSDGLEPNAEEAVRWLLAAAKAREPGAMNNLAFGYASGKVLPQNDAKAAFWYEQASDLGLARASYALAQLFEAGRGNPVSLDRAITFYQTAARQGDKRGLDRLAALTLAGTLDAVAAPHTAVPWMMYAAVENDDAAAMAWLEDQASKGVRPAQVQLGMWYLEQEGRVEEGVALLERAASAGSVSAQAQLGQMYTTGSGVPLDYVAAHKWLNIAAASGHQEAAETRSLINVLMTPDQIAQAQSEARVFFETVSDRTPQTDQTVRVGAGTGDQ
ncbi:MAG: SEL1-like repeat protein [Sulfitobacter sp.]